MRNICFAWIAVPLLSVVACADIVDDTDGRESISEAAVVEKPQPTHPTHEWCWPSGGQWWCNNRVATVYGIDGVPRDTLRSNPSWFQCRDDRSYSGGGPHPNRWLLTQGDDHGNWGWVRDIDIVNETNSLPRC